MNKQDLLQELSIKMRMGEISREEIANVLNIETKREVEQIHESKNILKFSINKMFYFLGAGIVIIGLMIFVSQIWDSLGSFGHIVVTLGIGLLLTALGSMLVSNKDSELGSIFHTIGGLLIPGGGIVTILEITSYDPELIHLAIIFSIISVFYIILNLIHKTAILTFFTIANLSATFGLVLASIHEVYPFSDEMTAYIIMIMGISYLVIGQSFRNTWNSQLVRPLYLFGTWVIFYSAFSLIENSVLWELAYPLLALGGVYLSVFLKSRIILVVSTLALLSYIIYITGEYFADSIGWPLALVILGFIFIGLGYVSININKKFISA